ncbi:MAG: TetR/AcrR family transcriptional regulator [Alphaproteobacteria bacterium]
MPKDSRALTPEDWIDGGLNLLAAKGVDKVSIAPLARELGVTKGSFYWHFKDRQALLDAMLRHWEEFGTRQIIERIEATGVSPSERLKMVVELAVEHIGSRLEPALRDWGRRDKAVWQAMRRVDNQRMEFLCRQFMTLCGNAAEAEARSWLFYSLLGGIHVLAATPVEIQRDRLLARCIEVLIR